MSKNIQHYIFQFLGFILLQVVVLNNIHLGGFVNPYPYALFLLILPPKMNKSSLLLVGFALGICIDIFSNSGGIHAAGSVAIAFIRPMLIRFVTSRPLEEIDKLNIYSIGVGNFLMYASISILIHHIILFNLDVFKFSEFFSTLTKALLSAVFSIVLIVFHQLITAKRRNEL